MTNHYDVIVLGAGAAGLMCAFTAAARGRKVLVLEKSNKVGKKILMSGGGRCNFTNLHVTPDNFLCANPHFVKSALTQYTQWDFIDLVEQHQIKYEERKHGELFCLDSARDILDLLLNECAKYKVTIETHCDVKKVISIDDNSTSERFKLKFTNKTGAHGISCKSLVVATGALSIPTLGGSGMGYSIGEQFKLKVLERRAGLVPFMFSDSTLELCKSLAGISVPVIASCNNNQFKENLLFTHRGISGPAILQISNYWAPGDAITINLLPNIDCKNWLLESKQGQGQTRLRTLLSPHLPKALLYELERLWWSSQAQTALAEWKGGELANIGEQLNAWKLKPSATEGYRTAEVTLGGIDTDAISSKTMAVKNQEGLYFIGEVLDVTGHLGGFNFQWAWASGYAAGSWT